MVLSKSYVVDTPNIVRYLERINQKYLENYFALIEFIYNNESVEFIVVVTPWMVKNMPNWRIIESIESIKNVRIKYSVDYDLDPDISLFEILKEIDNSFIISNDKFRNGKYLQYKFEIGNRINFELIEESNKIILRCDL